MHGEYDYGITKSKKKNLIHILTYSVHIYIYIEVSYKYRYKVHIQYEDNMLVEVTMLPRYVYACMNVYTYTWIDAYKNKE